jgi:hypothetical protein
MSAEAFEKFRIQRLSDLLELAGMLGFELKVGFDEFLEEIAFLFFRKIPPFGLDIRP